MSWVVKEGVETYLTESEMQNNATLVYNIFSAYGYTLEAICGILGNMEQECTINPALKQGESSSLGWGLIQWTPATELISYADSVGKNWTDADMQCELINKEVLERFEGRWIPTSAYSYSGQEFSQLKDVDEATKAFMSERERPRIPMLENRLSYARKWYEFLTGKPPTPPTPPTPTPTKSRKLPLYMMCRKIF